LRNRHGATSSGSSSSGASASETAGLAGIAGRVGPTVTMAVATGWTWLTLSGGLVTTGISGRRFLAGRGNRIGRISGARFRPARLSGSGDFILTQISGEGRRKYWSAPVQTRGRGRGDRSRASHPCKARRAKGGALGSTATCQRAVCHCTRLGKRR
jgi:hypothetical protein